MSTLGVSEAEIDEIYSLHTDLCFSEKDIREMFNLKPWQLRGVLDRGRRRQRAAKLGGGVKK